MMLVKLNMVIDWTELRQKSDYLFSSGMGLGKYLIKDGFPIERICLNWNFTGK